MGVCCQCHAAAALYPVKRRLSWTNGWYGRVLAKKKNPLPHHGLNTILSSPQDVITVTTLSQTPHSLSLSPSLPHIYTHVHTHIYIHTHTYIHSVYKLHSVLGTATVNCHVLNNYTVMSEVQKFTI
jgi:hypothetical protein